MLLAVDIGNTNPFVGVFSGDTLVHRWRLTTDAHRTADEYAILLQSLFRSADLDMRSIQGAIVCDVVPTARARLCEAIRLYLHVEPVVVSTGLDLGIDVRYHPPTAVGADRIANAVAAIERFPLPAVIVDFGTATTFDGISRDAAYLGGAIAPGIEIAVDALFAQTAQLPRAPLDPPEHAVGTSTVESLQSGSLYGYAALVDGLVERFLGELGADACVVATGGLAETVAPHTRTVQHVDTDLTLLGLRLLYHRNESHARRSSPRQD